MFSPNDANCGTISYSAVDSDPSKTLFANSALASIVTNDRFQFNTATYSVDSIPYKLHTITTIGGAADIVYTRDMNLVTVKCTDEPI